MAEAKAKSEAVKTDFLASNGGDTIALSSNVKMAVAFIVPGSFTMGSPASEEGRSSDENPVEISLKEKKRCLASCSGKDTVNKSIHVSDGDYQPTNYRKP